MGWASENSTSDSSSSSATLSGSPPKQSLELADGEQLAGGVVGGGDRHHAGVVLADGLQKLVHAAAHRYRLAVGAAGHDGEEGVGGPGGDEHLAGLDQRAGGGAQQLRGAVAHDQAAGVHAVAEGEVGAQLRAAGVGVALHTPTRDEGDGVDDVGVGEVGPGGVGEVERLHPRERLALALRGLLA